MALFEPEGVTINMILARRPFAHLVVGLLIVSTAISTSAGSGPVRMAVVALSSEQSIQAALDLVEVQLAHDTNFVVVERRDVDRLLSEQQWARGLLCDSERALRVGTMLKTDILVLSDTVPGWSGALSTVIFETTHGRRLWDGMIPAIAPDRQATQIVDCVGSALRKKESEDGITVCVVGVRNADLPRDRIWIGESVARLIERRLTGWPNVMLLERSYLDLWRREQALAFTTGVLRASTILMDLEVSRGDDGGEVRCTAYLSDTTGNILHKPSVHGVSDVMELTGKLWAEIGRALSISNHVIEVDRRVEAARFARESERMSAHGEMDKAFRSAAAAYALNPDDKALRSALIAQLVHRAGRLVLREPVAAVADMDQALDLSVGMNDGDPEKLFPSDLEILAFLERHKAQLLADAATHDALVDVHRKYLEIHDIGGESSTNSTQWCEREMAACSASSRDYVRNIGVQVHKWLALYDGSGVPWEYAIQRMWSFWLKRSTTYSPWGADAFARDEEFYRGLNDLCAEMAGAKDPLIQLLGKLGLLIHDAEYLKLSDEQIVRRWEEFRSQVEPYVGQLKKAPQNRDTQWRRSEAYWLLLDAADLVQDAGQRFALIQQAFDLTKQNHDVSYLVDYTATTDAVSEWRNFAYYEDQYREPLPENLHAQVISNVESVLAAMDDPSFEHPDPLGWERDKNWCRRRLIDYRHRWLSPEEVNGLHMILKMKDISSARSFECMAVRQGMVYLAAGLNSPTQPGASSQAVKPFGIRLLEVNPDCNEPRFLGDIPVLECRGIVPTEEGVLAATDDGLWLCVSDAIAPRRLGNGLLPSESINCMAVVHGEYFLGVGGDAQGLHFVRYNPKSKEMEVIASSERRESKTPFDNIHPSAYIRRIYPDLERNRLVLVVDRGCDMNNHFDYLPLIGLWAYDLESKTLQSIVECNRSMWAGDEANGRFLFSPWSGNPWQPGVIFRPWYGVLEFNLADDASEMVCSFKGLPAGPQLEASASTVKTDVEYQSPYLHQNGILFLKAQGVLQWMQPPNSTLRVYSHLNPQQLAAMDEGRSFLILTYTDLWRGDFTFLNDDKVKEDSSSVEKEKAAP